MTANPSQAPTLEARLIAVQRDRIVRQRVALLLLVPSALAAGVSAYAERARADRWRQEALCLQSQRIANASPATPTFAGGDAPSTDRPQAAPAPDAFTDDASYYPTTLIAEDGTETPLTGKALRIELGKEKTVEIFLQRTRRNFLVTWAPAKRENNYFNRVVFYPGCANAYALNLERVDAKSSDAADAPADAASDTSNVTYTASDAAASLVP